MKKQRFERNISNQIESRTLTNSVNRHKAVAVGSPSIKRSSKIFGGKRSVEINNHNGLIIKAESYSNLHAKR